VKVRFQADEDLNQTIVLATIRREPAVDFRTAVQASLNGLHDRDVLALAAEAGRILVTHDGKTMPRHFAEILQRTASPGVIVIPQHLPVATAVEELILLWSVTEPEEWKDRIVWLPL
jgi:hypothetical protein